MGLLDGKTADAEAAFRVAARFGWRQPTTQAYWYDAALQAGDWPRITRLAGEAAALRAAR